MAKKKFLHKKRGGGIMELPPKDIDEIQEEDYIYNPKNLHKMVEDDELEPEEQGFMQGYIEAIRA